MKKELSEYTSEELREELRRRSIANRKKYEPKYVEFECVLEYRNDRKPKYVVAVACSSLYGDYFTGGQGSTMFVDEWEFIYK